MFKSLVLTLLLLSVIGCSNEKPTQQYQPLPQQPVNNYYQQEQSSGVSDMLLGAVVGATIANIGTPSNSGINQQTSTTIGNTRMNTDRTITKPLKASTAKAKNKVVKSTRAQSYRPKVKSKRAQSRYSKPSKRRSSSRRRR